MSKTYTLELTADELRNVDAIRGGACPVSLVRKLQDLAARAHADREAEDLQLPWHVERLVMQAPMVTVRGRDGRVPGSLEAARLMAAAPELLEAVKAAKTAIHHGHTSPGSGKRLDVAAALGLIDRALRKVETGVAE